jgi:glycosyltransferase involved in cell wall biosynthesis
MAATGLKKSAREPCDRKVSDGSQAHGGDGQLLQKIQKLKPEIDNLRLHNHTLHIHLDHFSDLAYLFERALSACWLSILALLNRIKRIFLNRSGNDSDNYSATFRPYQVKILKPLQSNRPRVLHAIANFYTGGSARLVVDLVEHLGHKYEQEVITRDLPETAGYVGLTIHHYKRLTSPRVVLGYLKHFRPDFVHIHFLGHHNTEYSELDWQWYNQVFGAVQTYGCRIIENINIAVDPYISDAVSYYVYVSNYVRHEFGALNRRNVTIYPGCNLPFFSRRNPNIPDDCIGMVYRLEGDKLNDQSIDAFIKVVQRRPGTRALIVGGGSYLKSYRQAVQRAGVSSAFTFTGYVSYDELPAFYERLSLFVAPIHRESFGQVVPFAMIMKIPVVGYDVGALQEIIKDERLLAPAGNTNALADVIIELLDDRERRLRIGLLNHKRAQQFFSLEAMCSQYEAFYNEVITAC